MKGLTTIAALPGSGGGCAASLKAEPVQKTEDEWKAGEHGEAVWIGKYPRFGALAKAAIEAGKLPYDVWYWSGGTDRGCTLFFSNADRDFADLSKSVPMSESMRDYILAWSRPDVTTDAQAWDAIDKAKQGQAVPTPPDQIIVYGELCTSDHVFAQRAVSAGYLAAWDESIGAWRIRGDMRERLEPAPRAQYSKPCPVKFEDPKEAGPTPADVAAHPARGVHIETISEIVANFKAMRGPLTVHKFSDWKRHFQGEPVDTDSEGSL